MKDLVCDCSWLERISKSANNKKGVVVEFEDGSQAIIKKLPTE